MQNKERKPIYSILIEHREIPLLAVLALLLVAVSIRVPGYLGKSWLNVLKNGSINMVMCCGMLCVLLIGSIDISITAILAFAGAVAGNILGAWLGLEAIDPVWKQDLELYDELIELADDLASGCRLNENGMADPEWQRKYARTLR